MEEYIIKSIILLNSGNKSYFMPFPKVQIWMTAAHLDSIQLGILIIFLNFKAQLDLKHILKSDYIKRIKMLKSGMLKISR